MNEITYEIQPRHSSSRSLNICKETNNDHVSIIFALIFIVVLFGMYGAIYLIDKILPNPLQIVDEVHNKDAFIAERAQSNLNYLTNIGPRITGTSENEVQAVDFLNNEIDIIQKLAHPSQKIEKDLQVVSGSYFIDYKPDGAINSYSNVQNVVVKLHATNYSNHSLLVNAHFDSVATSPGGSDDGINCVVMLEILRKLAQSPFYLEHNIIFLFNGAEETPLQASHGFITQHIWAKEVRVVVNLEAAGAGGREILFQSGPNQPWLLDYYRKVPHPNGQVAGEEFFQSGFIPSDTDFRVFRDFGKVVGMDFAFNRDGYRYHTKFDAFKNIPPGSYQHVGDNMLVLIKNLANASELSQSREDLTGKIIFYDFFGLFLICYTNTVAIIINSITIIISVTLAIKAFHDFGLRISGTSARYIALSFGSIVLGWIMAALVVIIFAVIIDALKFSMSWYNNCWIILGLYCIPVITSYSAAIILFSHFNNMNHLDNNIHTQIQAHVLRIIWTLLLLIGTSFGIRSTYLLLIPIIFQIVSFVVIQIACLQHSKIKWQIIYIFSMMIPTVFLMKQALEIMAVIIPICGRMGSNRNPELIICFLTFLLTILIASYYVPFIILVRKSHILLMVLSSIFLIFFIIVFTPLGFPYSGDPKSPAPQRFWIYHMNRVLRNPSNAVYRNDSGFFLLNLDRNSPSSLKKYINLNDMKSVTEDCNQILFCGFPIASTRMVPVLRESTWIPAEQPILPTPINLELNAKTAMNSTVTRYNFTASGPNHFNIFVSPRVKANLINISLLSHLPPKAIIWNGRPTYIVMHSSGKKNIPLTFSIDFKTTENFTGSTFDISIAGKYMYDKGNNKTEEYVQFLNQFPDWADIFAWLGTYESWIY